ncbi:RDD family protein [Streptomyces sp. Ru87]|nr:RDD family protein [Streptomyces sp. Ru87]PGH50180.1 hypothetical protein CRI70_13480 [Streptomyces sp. Ru87]
MSTDQPPPGEPPDDDPLRKRPTAEGGGGPSGAEGGRPPGGGPHEPPGGRGAGGPYGGVPGGSPYDDPYGGAGGSYGRPGDPYGGAGDPYGGGPRGGPYGGTDPLAGMPPLANRGRRLLARIIDSLLIGIPVGVLMTLVVGGYDVTRADDAGRSGVVQLVVLLAYFVYEGLMLSASGQTVGKKLMRIRVAMLENGAVPAGRPGWFRAATYSLPQLVPCCGFVFWLVNVLFCTWDKPYQQCLHDKAAKTVVVSAD